MLFIYSQGVSSAILLSKMKLLFFSLWTKICQILHVIFESTNQFFFKICINIQYHQTWLLCIFELKRYIPLKFNFSKFSSFLVKLRQIPHVSFEHSSSNFASFFNVRTYGTPGDFKLIHFLLWIKGPHQSPNFKIFECSGENLPNSSCHFPNHKSVFLQILHHSSVSWNNSFAIFFSSTQR